MKSTELVPAATVASVCQTYADAQADVLEAFRLLHQVDTRLKMILEYPHFLPDNWYLGEASGPESAQKLLRDGWGFIYRKTRVWEVCSSKQRSELEHALQHGALPELTEPNVFAFLEKLQESLPDLFEQSLQEVFDWLRPSDRWGPGYKTNNKYAVGKKVILAGVMDQPWGGRYTVYYGKEQNLHALDNVFHLLDGQGVARYPHDLLTTLRAAGDKGGTHCATEYFSCKWFRNGNLHVTFRRRDLVKEINKRAGAAGLADYPFGEAEIVKAAGPGLGAKGDGDDDGENDGPVCPGNDAGVDADAAAGRGADAAETGLAVSAHEAGGDGAAPGAGGAL